MLLHKSSIRSFSISVPNTFNQDQLLLIQQEIEQLMKKDAVSEVLEPYNRCHSNLFLVPKEGGGQRLLINVKALNNFVQTQHFKMKGIHTLKKLVRPGDWLAKVDLKDSYSPSSEDVSQVIEFNHLPFELSSTPSLLSFIII